MVWSKSVFFFSIFVKSIFQRKINGVDSNKKYQTILVTKTKPLMYCTKDLKPSNMLESF